MNGRDFHLPVYGSAHKLTEERPSNSIVSSEEKIGSGAELLLEASIEAKLERLRSYNFLGQFKVTIETGWRYLVDHPNNDDIKDEMLFALQKLKSISNYNYLNGMVLTDGYKVSDQTENELQIGGLYSEETYQHIQSFL